MISAYSCNFQLNNREIVNCAKNPVSHVSGTHTGAEKGGGIGDLDSFIQSSLHHRAISVKNFLLSNWYLVLDIVMV